MSKQDKKTVLSQMPLSELKGLMSLYEIGIAVKSSFSKEEVENELAERKKIEDLYNEAKRNFGSTLDNLKD